MKPFASLSLEMNPQYNYELKNSTYIPTSKEEILNMDYTDLKILMKYNIPFYNTAVILLDREITKQLEKMRSWGDEEELRNVQDLEDLLHNTGYFGDDYEEARKEFVTMLLDILWDLAENS